MVKPCPNEMKCDVEVGFKFVTCFGFFYYSFIAAIPSHAISGSLGHCSQQMHNSSQLKVRI